jgi:Tfp pilus assembly protein PilO
MVTGRARQIWLIGGAIAAVLLVAGTWFGLVGPLNTLAGERIEQATDARLRLPTLHSKLTELEQRNRNLDQYQERLRSAQRALPTWPSTSDFLRQLHTSAAGAGATITDVFIEAPAEADPADEATAGRAMAVTVTASGTTAKLSGFLDQVQREQPRAVLIDSADLIPDDGAETLAGSASLTLRLQIFYAAAAPPVAAEPETVGAN